MRAWSQASCWTNCGCAEKHDLTFGPDPATHSRNTLGGMIGNNSCGIHSMMAGETVDNVEELDVVLYDGTRMRVGHDQRRGARSDHRGRRAQRRDLRQLRALRDTYADRSGASSR